MIEQIYDINGAYNLFKNYNLIGNNNCIFYVNVDNSLTASDIAKGVLLGSVAAASGISIIGVQNNNQNNNIHYSGYLFNENEYGIALIPFVNIKSGMTDDIREMAIVPNTYIFIKHIDIKNITVRQHIGLFQVKIKINLINGNRIVLLAYKKSKYVIYQENNVKQFREDCKKK